MTTVRKQIHRRSTPPTLTDKQVLRLEALEHPEIDLSDIPEPLNWDNALRGSLVRHHRLPIGNEVYMLLQRDG